ncbi:MAG: hypothetical protein AUJ72_04325 [Candidatus Omnitrophica bacterium CG1_02_46_14]|nr:MAG: hypothetical protein AUJ72_04325 [Candidatus Omnitrophica bacterium CG1_02_46_14]
MAEKAQSFDPEGLLKKGIHNLKKTVKPKEEGEKSTPKVVAAEPTEAVADKTSPIQTTAPNSWIAQTQIPQTEPLLEDERILSALGYISFLCVLPLVLRTESDFCQFHGKQALVLTMIFFFVNLLAGVFFVFRFLLPLLLFIEFIVIVVAIIKALRGGWWRIPFVYEWSQSLKF